MATTLASGTTGAVQKQNLTLEQEVFKLKLEWIMAKSDDEKRRISEQIRRLIEVAPSKGE